MIVLAALVLAVSGPTTPRTSATAVAGDRDQIVCRQRPVTGTRLRFTRTCMTRGEWATQHDNITRGMQDITTRRMTDQPPPPITPGSD